MYPYKRIVIAQHERGLHLKDRSLIAVLEPGVHRIFDPFRRVAVHIHDLTVTEFTHPQADVFVKSVPELVARHFHVVHLADGEAGLVYKDTVRIGIKAE